MDRTTLHLHTGFAIAPVDPRIFGGFIEHMGRCVYEGLYQPTSKHADQDGFRTDVLGALAQLKFTAMRYPGGNFVSGYHWRDGVGPRNERPTRYDLAWHSIEPNQVGTDEYMQLVKRLDWTAMLAVNLGTGTPEEAARWVEYCNLPAGTREADDRIANQQAMHLPADPHGVKLWCLGNEMDGVWQIGHMPARDYALKANSAARAMKQVDPSIELVVCGSCGVGMDSYMAWDREVLELTAPTVEYISLHRYVGNKDNDTPNYLGVTNSIDTQIEEMDAACRFVQAQKKMDRKVLLCFDEWNVWYKAQHMEGGRTHAPHLIEEVYNLEDALVVAGFLMSFIRHADSVKIANLAQIVNIIAPILTQGDQMLIQSIYHSIALFAERREGISLRPSLDGPAYKSARNGSVQVIDSAAILSSAGTHAGKQLHVFLTNRDLKKKHELVVDLADRKISGVANAEIVTGKDPKAANSFEKPAVIAAKKFSAIDLKNGQATVTLPPLSFVAITFDLR